MAAAGLPDVLDDEGTRRGLSRRGLLRLALAGAAGVPFLTRVGSSPAGASTDTIAKGVLSGTAPMPGPAVRKFEREMLRTVRLRPTETRSEIVLGRAAKVDYYDITQKVATADLLPAPFPRTEIWGYNGLYPGPTLRQKTGGNYTVVRNTNALPAQTSTHLHSSPTQPAHDGHPDDLTYRAGELPVGVTSDFDARRRTTGRTCTATRTARRRARCGTTTTGCTGPPGTSTRGWPASSSRTPTPPG